MPKIILISIDGLGIGFMPDALQKANTWKTLLSNASEKDFPYLKKIMPARVKIALDYQGADSFLGHLTMSGINTTNVSLTPLANYFRPIQKLINDLNYTCQFYEGMIIVNDSMLIYDNFEADHGLAINLAGLKDKITFDEQVFFAQKIRKIINNPRLITFAAHNVTLNDLKKPTKSEGNYNGIATPKTGIYNATFEVRHLPLKLNFASSIQQKFLDQQWNVKLYGKFANIIQIKHQKISSDANIEINYIFNKVINDHDHKTIHFINLQQTDLAGHLGNISLYISALNKIDVFIKKLWNSNQKVIIISDHGNDPQIKDGKHNREYVPLITNFPLTIKITKLSQLPQLLAQFI